MYFIENLHNNLLNLAEYLLLAHSASSAKYHRTIINFDTLIVIGKYRLSTASRRPHPLASSILLLRPVLLLFSQRAHRSKKHEKKKGLWTVYGKYNGDNKPKRSKSG